MKVCTALFALAFLAFAGCGDDDGGTGTAITAVTAGEGLTGGGTEGEVTLSADTQVLQQRVDDACTGNSAVQGIDVAGMVSCSPEMSLATHNHDTSYAAVDHNHDGDYSAADHNHDGDYSAIDHNHDGDYAPAVHDHAGVYAPAVHDHDASYFPKASFTGTDYGTTGRCTNATGSFIIGNVQDEFGCRLDCDTICQRHGMICDQARKADGTPGSCSAVSNSAILYCWCIGQ